jgi:hypothetical protein
LSLDYGERDALVRRLSAEQVAAAAAVAYTGRGQVMEMKISWSLGYSPDRPGGARSRAGSTFGMVGTNESPAWTTSSPLAYPPPTNPEDRNP